MKARLAAGLLLALPAAAIAQAPIRTAPAVPPPSETAPAPAPAPSDARDAGLAGLWRFSQPEIAAELLLTPEGRFRFVLAYGSLDAQAEGTWRSDGQYVFLTNARRPVPPVFEAAGVARQDDAPFRVMVTAPNGEGVGSIELRVEMADGRIVEGRTSNQGWLPWEEEGQGRPVAVSLSGYGIGPVRFPVDLSAGNDFRFRFVPNDFQMPDFQAEPLAIREGRLVLGQGPGSVPPEMGMPFERAGPGERTDLMPGTEEEEAAGPQSESESESESE